MEEQKMSKIDQYAIQKVKEMREERGLSQAALSFRMEVSIGLIGQIESPKHPHKYNLTHLNKLAAIFDCSPKDFLPDRAL